MRIEYVEERKAINAEENILMALHSQETNRDFFYQPLFLIMGLSQERFKQS